MIKSILVNSVLILALFLAGCSSGKAPRSTAQAFLENLVEGKLTEAKKYATEQTSQLLDMVSSMGGLEEIDPNSKFIFVDETVDGNKAVVKYRQKAGGEVETIDLVKIDGIWKVHIQKD